MPASDPPEAPGQLARVLGPLDATCVVVGAIVGVGIFFTPSRVAEIAGSERLALLAWAVGGLIALLGALTFAQLGAMYSGVGGQYTILRDAYGPAPAFLFVFCNATAIQGGAIAIIAIVCAKHLGIAASGLPPAAAWLPLVSLALILCLVAANILGVRWGAGIQNATVFGKVAALLLVTALAAFAAPDTVKGAAAPSVETLTQPAPPAAASGGVGQLVATLFAAIVPAFFSYGGWQHALWMAGEVRRPTRNVPLAILVGVSVVVTVYLLVNWAYLRLLGVEGVAGSAALASDAVATVWPAVGSRLTAGAVALSAFGVLNAQLLSGPRLIYRMAQDGRFFALFARVSPRFGSPAPAILLLGAVALLLLLSAGEKGVDRLLTGVVFVDGVFFALTGAALLVLRRRAASAPRWSFAYPIAPLLFVLGEVGLLCGAYWSPDARAATHIGMLWIAGAALVYLVFLRKASTPLSD